MGNQAEIEVGRQWRAELAAMFDELRPTMGRAEVRECRTQRTFVMGTIKSIVQLYWINYRRDFLASKALTKINHLVPPRNIK